MKRLALITCLVALMVALPITGCAPEEVAPPEERVIKIGTVPDLTSHYSAIVTEIYRGGMLRIHYLNEAGGINGIPIEVMWVDGRSDASVIIAAYKRFKEQGMMVFWPYTSTDATPTLSFINRDKMPTAGYSSSGKLYVPPGYYFYAHCNPFHSFTVALKWYENELKRKGLDRPMRLATLGMDSPYGREGLQPRTVMLPQHGIELVSAQWVSSMSLDHTTELLLIKEAKPDVICTITNTGVTARDAGRIGLPKDIPIWGLGMIETASYADLGGDEYYRAMSANPVWLSWEACPVEEEIGRLYQKYFGKMRPRLPYGTLSGWATTGIACEGIRKALDKVGYEALTNEAIFEGILSLEDWDAESGALISYQDYPGDRVAQEIFKIWRYSLPDKDWRSLTDWLEAPPFSEYVEYFE